MATLRYLGNGGADKYIFCLPLILYLVRPQDVPQEMERNEATAKHVDWPSCAWLLLRFFPFPVGDPVPGHGSGATASLPLLGSAQSRK